MAKQQKISFTEFRKQFNDEDSCREYLFTHRWSTGFTCPKCGHNECYSLSSRKIYQCKACRHQTSVTAGTVMHRSHLPLVAWFWAIYFVARDKRGYSALQLSRELDLPYNTAWFLLQRIRFAMAQRDSKYTLSGLVELDDTYFGSPKNGGKRGRGTEKTKVLVALSKGKNNKPQFLRMQVVDDIKSDTIKDFAQQAIDKGTTIQSDGYHSYRKPLSEDYRHEHQVFDTDSDLLKWLHIVIGNAKAFVLGTYHGLGEKHLQSYLDEFCYRLNRRFFQDELFPRLIVAVANSVTGKLAVSS